MQIFAVLLVAVAAFASTQAGLVGLAAPATTLVRTPSLDSAVIQSDRLGGNFAYSSVEGHAYAAVSPVVQHVQTPVAVSYSAHALPYAAPAVSYAAAPYAAAYAAPYAYPYAAAPSVVVAK